MSVAAGAGYLVALHAQAVVQAYRYIFLGDRRPETRPAGAGLELCFGVEERSRAADTEIQTIRVVVCVLTGEGTLGSLLPCHLQLKRRYLGLPLPVALLYLLPLPH